MCHLTLITIQLKISYKSDIFILGILLKEGGLPFYTPIHTYIVTLKVGEYEK